MCSGGVSGPRVNRGARTSILSSLRDRLCALRPSQQKCCPRYHTSLLSRHTCGVPALCLLRLLAPAPTLLPSTRCAASTFASSSSLSRSSARNSLWCHRHSATAPLRSLRTSPLFLTHYHARSFLSASTVYALSARHGSSCSVLALTRPSLSFSASSRALASTKVSGCSAEEAVMRVNSDNAATPRRTKKAQAARKALPATGKRKYTRRAGATVPTPEVNGVNDTTVGVSASGSAITATDVTHRPSSQRGGSDASDTDAHDVHEEEEVYNKQYELSPEETYRQTSARLMLPLHAVQFVLAQAKEGATVPFLARYRRGETGRMDETQLRLVMDTAKEVAEVHRRRQFMLRSLESRGLLTPALHTALKSMTHVSQLEDAWEPYKERRTSLASRGRAAGLGPYAAALLGFNPEDPECKARLDELSALVRRTDDGERLLTAIVAEDVQRSEELRRRLSEYCRHTARLSSTMMTKPRKKVAKELHKESFEALRKHFAYYDNKSWSVQRVAAHVVLALERGEAKGALKVDMVTGPKSHGLFMHAVRQQYPALNRLLSSPSSLSSSSSSEGTAEGRVGSFRVLGDWRYARKIIQDGLQAAYDHLIKQTHFSIRRDLKKSAEQEAIVVFAHNLHHMLLQRPLTRSRILAMDPGLANGVKCVALDEHGAVETFFTCTLMDEHKMRRYVIQVVESRKLNKIVIGNGTASGRATELVADIIKQQQWTDVEFAIVSEAGASVYSVSDIAKEEFPDLDVMYRGAVSIGRRVLDPLSELVKIPVRSMGIGMYQHDVNEKDLMKELNYVLGSCVARVGVNAASANRCVMEKVPGISKRIVDQIVLARHARKLLSREDLRRVPAMTESVYQQIAGFFRFPNSPEPLDNTNIHPESYPLVRRLVSLYMAGQLGDDGAVTEKLEEAGDAARIRQQVAKRLERMSASQLTDLASEKLLCSVETLELLRQELLHPALDPRASLLHAGLLRREVCDVKDLRPGQLLSGVVQSVTMFGAFVDCGLHDSVLLRGEGVDALQVGMYLDQRIRFDCLDHLKRPRVFLVRAVAAPSPTSGDSSGGAKAGAPSTAPRRLRLESEDILSSDGRGFVSQAEPDAHLYDSLATDAEGVTALAPTLTARVMQERRRRAEEALGSANSPSVMGALRAATSSQTISPSRASLSHPPVTKRARAELGTSDAFHQARRRVETVVAVSAAACPQATPSVPSPPCPAVKSAPGTLSASTSQMSKPTSQRVDVAGGGDRGQDGASSRIENTVFSF
ncbi:hypothetical protein JKF63_07010 [Porcisia hertigi]|uniref:YqgF/RNase H-like domain-containing protein n=1 Tax=Porcisia hertigi TaxID=2761500 RepID=A0A836IIB8_9TRYP|nr:hypothetical protein JKF63_07010 [Porcisia hertigi]